MQKLADVFCGMSVSVALLDILFSDCLGEKLGGFRTIFMLLAISGALMLSAKICEWKGEENAYRKKRQ